MRLLTTIIIMLIAIPALAQKISGTIISEDNKPLSNITISLQGTAIHTSTSYDGHFILNNVTRGNYTLVATGVAYSAIKQNVIVAENDLILDLKLIAATRELREVKVTAAKNHYRDQASAMAARLPFNYIENPQVINLVSSQILTDQSAFDYNLALKNIPGIAKSWSSVNGFYYSRGFNTRSSYLRNGVAGNSSADLDLANMDQLEVIKGPSATLFGSILTSFGGVINRITKTPFDTTHVEISYQAGSYDLSRITVDLNTPLTLDKKVLFRLNAAHQYSGSFQDAGFLQSYYFAPSLLYRISDRLNINFDAEIYSRESTSQPQFSPIGPGLDGIGVNNPIGLPLEYRKSYGNNTIKLKDPTQSFYTRIKYKISDNWNSQTDLSHVTTQNTGNYLYFNLLKGDSLLTRNIIQIPTTLSTTNHVQENITGDFRIGKLRNRLLLGLDYYQNSSNYSSRSLSGFFQPSFDTLNLKHNSSNYSMLTPQLINQKLANSSPDFVATNLSTYAAYASDVINFTDRFSAMLSLRIDKYVNDGTTDASTNISSGKYNQTALSPKLGLVYQIITDQLSVFGNYTNGFQNVAPVTQPNGSISTFKPQYANQFEVGFKADLSKNLLNASLSYYDIRVTNTLRGEVDQPAFEVQEGTQFSKGIELDVFSKPITGLQINAGFAYNDSKITSADPNINGLRPADSGPEKIINWYGSYNLYSSPLSVLGLGFGGNYYDRNLIINNGTAGQFYLNSYTTLDAGVFYQSQKYRFGININNLTDQHYYTGGFGTFTPGMLRSCIASLMLKF